MNNLVGTKKYSGISSGKSIRFSFTGAFASGWDDSWQLVALGGGMSSSQASGNGSIVSGTTANSETIYRFKSAISGDYNLRSRLFISARNANQSTFLELVDVIGDNLAITVNSATSVTVTFPQSFIPSAQNVGQNMNIGDVSGIANAVPGRYAIASVSGQNVNFTVAGWPASGSGTCSIFGWNGSRLTYDGTTATTGKFDSYRNGYGSGDTSQTIATTASPGQVVAINAENGLISVVDSTQNSGTFTPRFTRSENIPDQTATLYLQVRVVNGTSAPSTTTVSVGYVYIDEWESSVVSFGRQPGSAISPSVIVSSGSVTVSGTSNEDFSAPASAVVVGGVVRTAVAPTTLIANDTCRMTFSSAAQAIFKPFAVAEIDWQYTGILTTTTAAAMRAAGAASIRNYLTGFSFQNTSATATTILILDGATTIAQFNAPASMVAPVAISFATPLKGTAATAMNVNCGTAGANVLVNSQGYQSP